MTAISHPRTGHDQRGSAAMTRSHWASADLHMFPRRYTDLDVEPHRIMDAIDRSRHQLGGRWDGVSVIRKDGTCIVLDRSASGRTINLAASVPEVVVAHVPKSDDDETRMTTARIVLDAVERGMVVQQGSMDDDQDHRAKARGLASLLRHLTAAVVGEAWKAPSLVKVRPPSPFGPAVASIWISPTRREIGVVIPDTILLRHGVEGSWCIAQKTEADASALLTTTLGVSDDVKPRSHIELMREMAVEGMEELVMSLAQCHPSYGSQTVR